MRHKVVMGCVAALTLGLACKPGEDHPVESYQQAIASTEQAEKTVSDAYIVIQQYLNLGPDTDEAPPIAHAKQTLVSAQETYVKALEAIVVKNPQLKSIHGLLLAAERHRLNGFYELAGALRDTDGVVAFRNKTSPAELAVAEAKRRIEAYSTALDEFSRNFDKK